VQEQKLLQVLEYTLEVSRARLSLAEKKFSLGAASEVDLNQARIDMSTDSTLFIKQDVLIKNLVADINTMAGRSPEIRFAAEYDILPGSEVDYAAMLSTMQSQNYTLLLMRADVQLKYQDIRQKRAELMPALNLFTNYSYSTSRSETGIVETSTVSGPAFGFNLNYTLFDGLNNRRELLNSKIEHQSAQVRVDETVNALHNELFKMHNIYAGAEKQVILETKNLENAGKNLTIAIELYKSGAINEIEFRDIQRKALEAENRLLVAEYTTRIAELNLKQISGTLQF
jgi:outer membrane protein TolC